MKILIIEDEQVIANRLLRMCKAYFGDSLEDINHRDSITDGLEYFDQHKIDLLLLDLNLNGESGFEVLKKVVSQSFQTIIVSAYKDRAIEAFEYGVLDFVPKPFNEKRLSQALSRSLPDTIKNPKAGAVKFLSILKRGNLHLIDLKELNYIKGARVYTEIHLKDGKTEIHNKSLDALDQLLPANFERIHKSYIVNMENVVELEVASGGKYTAILNSGDQLPVSRSKYKALKSKYFI